MDRQHHLDAKRRNEAHRAHAEAMDGKLHELDLLYPDNDPRLKALRNKDVSTIEYKPYEDALREATQGNPLGYTEGESFDPPAAWAKRIHKLLFEKLHLTDKRLVRVYPAINTALDRFHGVDFLIRFTHPTTRKTYDVEVDITLLEDLSDKRKKNADLFVTTRGAVASDKHPYVSGLEIDDADDRTETETSAMRREAVATVVLNVLQEKMQREPIANIASQTRTQFGRTLGFRTIPDEPDDEPRREMPKGPRLPPHLRGHAHRR